MEVDRKVEYLPCDNQNYQPLDERYHFQLLTRAKLVDVRRRKPKRTKAGDRLVRMLRGMIGSTARFSANAKSGTRTTAMTLSAMTVFEVTGQCDDVTREEATMKHVICVQLKPNQTLFTSSSSIHTHACDQGETPKPIDSCQFLSRCPVRFGHWDVYFPQDQAQGEQDERDL